VDARRKFLTPLALAAVAVTALAACSSGSSTATTTTTTSTPAGSSSTTAGTTASGSVIKLGIVTDVGGAVNNADEVGSARAGVRYVNAHGGINGHQVQLEFCNGNLNPITDQSCVRTMISDGVMAMVGDEMVTYEESGDKLLSAAGIANVAPVPYSYDFTDPNSYLLSDAQVLMDAAQDVAAQQYGGKRVGYIEVNIPTTVPYVAAHKKLLPTLGETFAGDVEVPEVATDYSTQAAALLADKPSVISTDSTAASDMEIFKGMVQLGYTGKEVIDADALTLPDIQSLGSLADKLIIASAFPPVSAASQFPGIAEYKAAMAAELASGDQSVAGYEQFNQDLQMLPFFGLLAIQQIADQAHATDAASFKTAINAATNVNLGGVVPPWTPNKSVSTVFPRLSIDTGYVSQWQNGGEKLLSPTAISLAKDVAASNAAG
jgi:ABC-type branched-subunit amino acid transport system substrate-binding protein